jgi:Holliday junction DNA helicase RuvA
VGKKTAARLLLELKARLELPTLGGATPVSTGTDRTGRGEVRAALTELGYGPDEIRGALEHLPDDGPVEELLRSALRELARTR